MVIVRQNVLHTQHRHNVCSRLHKPYPHYMSTHILLIAHAPLAHALRECALHVLADCGDSVLTLDVLPHDAPEDSLAQALQLLQPYGQPPLLVLSVVFGAPPSNIAHQLVRQHPQARLITGVNLPMLLRSVCYRAEPLDALVQRAVVGGTQGVMQVDIERD